MEYKQKLMFILCKQFPNGRAGARGIKYFATSFNIFLFYFTRFIKDCVCMYTVNPLMLCVSHAVHQGPHRRTPKPRPGPGSPG
jgi:hypothetical protein